jgi:hypothetical protein
LGFLYHFPLFWVENLAGRCFCPNLSGFFNVLGEANRMTDILETVEPFFLSGKETRHVLGDMCETTYWDWVQRGLIPVVYIGRKAVSPYPPIKALREKILAGELASPKKAFKDHEAAIAKSIASRRLSPPERRQRRMHRAGRSP